MTNYSVLQNLKFASSDGQGSQSGKAQSEMGTSRFVMCSAPGRTTSPAISGADKQIFLPTFNLGVCLPWVCLWLKNSTGGFVHLLFSYTSLCKDPSSSVTLHTVLAASQSENSSISAINLTKLMLVEFRLSTNSLYILHPAKFVKAGLKEIHVGYNGLFKIQIKVSTQRKYFVAYTQIYDTTTIIVIPPNFHQ